MLSFARQKELTSIPMTLNRVVLHSLPEDGNTSMYECSVSSQRASVASYWLTLFLAR
jgi:hypothetical protein